MAHEQVIVVPPAPEGAETVSILHSTPRRLEPLWSGPAATASGRGIAVDAGSVAATGRGRKADFVVQWRGKRGELLGSRSVLPSAAAEHASNATRTSTRRPAGLDLAGTTQPSMSSTVAKAAQAISGLSAKPNPKLLPQLLAAQVKLRTARRVGDAAAAAVARKDVMALAKACLPPDVCVSERRAAKTAIAYWLQRAYAARGLSM